MNEEIQKMIPPHIQPAERIIDGERQIQNGTPVIDKDIPRRKKSTDLRIGHDLRLIIKDKWIMKRISVKNQPRDDQDRYPEKEFDPIIIVVNFSGGGEQRIFTFCFHGRDQGSFYCGTVFGFVSLTAAGASGGFDLGT